MSIKKRISLTKGEEDDEGVRAHRPLTRTDGKAGRGTDGLADRRTEGRTDKREEDFFAFVMADAEVEEAMGEEEEEEEEAPLFDKGKRHSDSALSLAQCASLESPTEKQRAEVNLTRATVNLTVHVNLTRITPIP